MNFPVLPRKKRRVKRRPLPFSERSRRFLYASAWVGLLVGVAFGGRFVGQRLIWFIRYSDFFQISQVELAGEVTPELESEIRGVIASIKDEGLDNLFLFDLAAARDRIEALPRVRMAALSKRYPQTIFIAVEERTPLVAVLAGGLYWMMDRDGVLLYRADAKSIVRFGRPILTGLRAAYFAPGAVIDQPRLRDTLDTIEHLREERPRIARKFHEWHLNNEDEVEGILAEGVEVFFGDSHPLERMAKLEAALASQTDLKNLTYLDLRFEGRVVIR